MCDYPECVEENRSVVKIYEKYPIKILSGGASGLIVDMRDGGQDHLHFPIPDVLKLMGGKR